ncbi:hypothetical protein PV328_006749 [Microctonus aethiopoides]|uniref:Uncharacterized protein n=1 Tax=Microctonus aethiopoides TaxID=144406 RepID=A0AA39KTV7_9HYME|nr:hypothetical protein PV328_006749 [Microctonus aethiopoides]
MKFRFSFKWSILILSLILNLHCIECIADVNSRSLKSVQSDNLEILSDDYDDNIDDMNEQYNYLDDYKHADVDKRYASLETNEQNNENDDNLMPESEKTIVQITKRATDFELAKFELEKVKENVENEILNLDKLYKTEKKKRQTIKNDEISSSLKGKIHVETNELVKKNFNSKEREKKSASSIATRSLNHIEKNPSSNMLVQSKKELPIISNEKKIENAIQTRIDAIKAAVKRRIKAEVEREMIKKMNAKYDELQRINRVKTQTNNHNQLLKPTNNKLKLGNKRIRKRPVSKQKKNKLAKEKKKIKKSIHKPNKIFVDMENKSSSDVRVQDQLTSLKSKREGNRFKRRFRKPPEDAKIHHRFSRRFRKPPGVKFSSLKNQKNNYNRKNRHVINLKNSTAKSNFLFRKNSQRKRSSMFSDHVKQLALSQNKKKSSKFKRNKQLIKYLENSDDFVKRKERALDNLSNEKNLVVNSNDLADTINSQDFSSSSHLISQYEGTFGDYNKNNRDNISLIRYKRVKRS